MPQGKCSDADLSAFFCEICFLRKLPVSILKTFAVLDSVYSTLEGNRRSGVCFKLFEAGSRQGLGDKHPQVHCQGPFTTFSTRTKVAMNNLFPLRTLKSWASQELGLWGMHDILFFYFVVGAFKWLLFSPFPFLSTLNYSNVYI